MKKTILLTGATDGIGLMTARMLADAGQHVLLHGRSLDKLKAVEASFAASSPAGTTESYVADLSRRSDVDALATSVLQKHERLDVVINNAGVFKAAHPMTQDGLDVRFVVNTIAPYVLTRRLVPSLGASGRVVNVSSAAQATVDLDALKGRTRLSDNAAYAQSKLAITAWSRHLAHDLGEAGPVIVAVNPASMLGSKMVKEAFGVAGGDLQIGADILVRAALSDEFSSASGQYYDNDRRRFDPPHPDALDANKSSALVRTLDALTAPGAPFGA